LYAALRFADSIGDSVLCTASVWAAPPRGGIWESDAIEQQSRRL
jgi:hypothetical protein